MDKETITFSATQQTLIKTGGIDCFAAETVKYVEARFDLGENWSGFDHIDAIWTNDGNFTQIAKTLDPQGVCIVPVEVLSSIGDVRANLVGTTSEDDEVAERMTTYPIFALGVNANVPVSGSETQPITPSQFDQFVQIVIAEVEKVTGMTAEAVTLPPGSDATAEYTNGKLILGIPQGIQGEKGDTGETGATPDIQIGSVETLPAGSPAEVTITGTPEDPELNFKIPKGDTGEVTLEDLSSLLPTDTASGDIISIPDGQSVVPVKSLKVTLEPIQSGSGTPSPDNVRPISGRTEVDTHRTGKNLFDVDDFISGVDCGSDYFAGGRNAVAFDKQGTYTIKANTPSAGYLYARIKNADGTFGAFQPIIQSTTYTARTLTVADEQTLLLFDAISNTLATTKSNVNGWSVQVELSATATDYEPYQGTSYTTDLDRTVYGGTLDVVSGELVVDRAMIALDGTQTGVLANWTPRDGTSGWLYPYGVAQVPTESGVAGLITDSLPTLAYDRVWAGDAGISIVSGTAKMWSFAVRVAESGLDTVAKVNAYLAENPITVVYPLATPQTYQLDPQQVMLLHGNNNVWSDGEVELTYNADVQLWVLKKLGSGTRLTSVRPTLSVSQNPAEVESEDASEEEIK